MRLKLDPEFSHLYPSSDKDPDLPTIIEFVVKPRSLYILSGALRYHYTHEILGSSTTDLTPDVQIQMERRLSIMLRDKK